MARKSPAKSKTPPAPRVRADPVVESDGGDDEAPEVVSKQSAQQQDEERRRIEKEARKSAAASNKRKRTPRTSTAEEAKKPLEAVEELPEDILSAVAAHHEEEEAEQEEETAYAKAAAKRLRAALQKKTHTRQFGNVHVQTVGELERVQTRPLSADAEAFLARQSAPQRARMSVLEGHASLFTRKQKQRAQQA